MTSTSARTLRLLSLLRQQGRWTGPGLAAELGVSVRTVRRDVGTLRDLGYAVEVSRGAGGHYALGSGGGTLPPLLLDDEQATAVAVALQLAPRTVDGLQEAAGRALATVLEVMPSRSRHLVGDMQVASVWNPWELAAPSVPHAVLLAVSSALRDRRTLRYDYEGTEPGPARLVEPHHLVVWAGRWYLLGHDPGAGTWRTVRLDRVRPRTPDGPRFAARPLPEGTDAAHVVMSHLDRGDTADHWPCRGTATVAHPAETITRFVPGGAVVVPLGAASSRLTMGAWSWVGLAGLFATFDAPLADVEPAELREACGVVAARLAPAGER
ncbi:helix-turn-helix transcriptional regulator [Aquipuribacter hungaricus]|uniref:Helix-turn-helix transcriptional regulator n=1 Tax=Aquipuribacter hungaricus TaxID=545624 RepID=A0ABV7WCY0_9MICO